MAKKERAEIELKDGIEKFKCEAISKGWEEDEVNEKITEVFENFPWYKFSTQRKSWKSILRKILLCSFIFYLAATATLERNKRWKKHVDDFIYDNQFAYQTQRFLRFLTLPLFRIYDLSALHNNECLVHNPFLPTGSYVDCVFCEGVDQITSVEIDNPHIQDMIKNGSPFVVTNAPGYISHAGPYEHLREMMRKNADQIDDASCKIRLANTITKVSDFFKLSEEEIVERNMSIAWRNCDTYGTRFYRMLYSRLEFIPKTAEVFLEKEMMLLQKGVNMTLPPLDGDVALVAQIQGESVFSLRVPGDCHNNCTSELKTNLKQGEIIALSHNAGWITTFESVADGLSIFYISSFK